jgi:hypothetical protein
MALALLALPVLWIARDPTVAQWDFRVYWAAGRAWEAGLNPYDPHSLELGPGYPVTLPWVYSPALLPLAWVMSRLDYSVGLWVHLGVDLALLAGLVVIGWRAFGREQLGSWAGLALLTVGGFDGAGMGCILTGNLSLWSQVLVALGVWAWLERRDRSFGVCIGAAGVLSLQPIVLLPLAFLGRGWNARGAVVLGVLVFAVPQALAQLAAPDLYGHWLDTLLYFSDETKVDPSTLNLMRWMVGEGPFATVLYGAAVATLGIGLARAWRAGGGVRTRLFAGVALIAFTAALPHLRPYGLPFLAAPAILVALQSRWRSIGVLLVLLVLCPWQMAAGSLALLVPLWGLWMAGVTSAPGAGVPLSSRSRPSDRSGR